MKPQETCKKLKKTPEETKKKRTLPTKKKLVLITVIINSENDEFINFCHNFL